MLPFRLLPTSQFGPVLLRTSFATIAVLLILFVGSAIAVQTDIRHAIAQQESIRRVELLRALSLRLQLDEETGLRGFVITGSRSFLAPFERGRAQMPGTFAQLDAQLADVAPSLVTYAREEQNINAQWLSTVALPIITRPSAGTDTRLELSGKSLINGFRNVSSVIETSLTQLADEGDAFAERVVTGIDVGSILFGILLTAALLFYAGAQMRLGQTISRQADEYDRLSRMAATLQKAFLVEPLPRVKGLAFDAVYAPALEEARVGGDWYGVIRLPDGRVYFSMGDVAGHGVEASVTMARIRQTILSIAMHELDPSVVLERANEVLRVRTEMLVTALVGFIDPETHDVSYASAGHLAPLLVTSDGKAELLPTSGAPLGVTADPSTHTFARSVPPGAMLVLYTDGIVEFDRDLIRGERRLRDVASAVMRDGVDRPAMAILRRTLGLAVQRDDIAVLAVGFKKRANGKTEKNEV